MLGQSLLLNMWLIVITNMVWQNQMTVSGKTASFMQHAFNSESSYTKGSRHTAQVCIDLMLQILQNRPHLSISSVRTGAEWQLAWRDASSAICTPQPTIVCDAKAKFRTIDGVCNNLVTPTWGQSFRPQARFLIAQYDDQVTEPRSMSVSGGSLPTPRTISNIVFRNVNRPRFHKKFTMLLMSFGQFLDHDLTFTPTMTDADGSPLECCPDANPRPDGCYPIPIPAGDPFFTTTCMNFVRSSPVFNDPCRPGTREQMNELTSFVDGSNVYGSTETELRSLRIYRHGLLITSDTNNLPPDHDGECVPRHPTDYCMNAGDRRVNEVAHLSVHHITMVREHNRIAKKLSEINSHWDDERLFQETRKIIGAILQKITYDDWLPLLLHRGYIRKFCLKSSRSYRCRNLKYSPVINPTVRNAFAAAALRMGHSLVPPKQGVTSKYYLTTSTQLTEDHFFNPHLPLYEVDGMARFGVASKSMVMDRFVIAALRDKLFTDGDTSFDLVSLNIQRGRDHGLPSYTAFRRFCGYSEVRHFKRSRGGLIDHDKEAAAKLEEAYKHPNDIDVFAGGISECPLPGSLLGPTFSCLFAKQFRALRYGDRFFYENKGLPNSFTSSQIRSIKKVTLAKITCVNHHIKNIQRNVFKQTNRRGRVSCKKLQDIDLEPWRE